jgi:hypothetical protein
VQLTEMEGPKITVEFEEGAPSKIECQDSGAVLCSVRTMIGRGWSIPFSNAIGPVLKKLVDLIPGA